MKVYKETLYQIEKSKGISSIDLSTALGFSKNHISQLYSKAGTKGYVDFAKPMILAICSILECSESELTDLPKSRKLDSIISSNSSSLDIAHLEKTIKDIGFMIHEDLERLIRLWDSSNDNSSNLKEDHSESSVD